MTTCASGRTSGTCVPECPSYGLCHCGCGMTTRISEKNHTARQRTAGMHVIWFPGHAPGSRANYRLLDAARRQTYNRHPNDVPIEKVRPLAKFLHQTHGTVSAVASAAGIPRPTLNHVLYASRTVGVHKDTAERIVAAVLAIRNQRNPDAPHLARAPLLAEMPAMPARHHRGGKLETFVAASPLADYLDYEGYRLDSFGGSLARNLHRWIAADRAPLFAVDEFCIEVLQVHPTRVYGDEWPDSPSFNEQEAIA